MGWHTHLTSSLGKQLRNVRQSVRWSKNSIIPSIQLGTKPVHVASSWHTSVTFPTKTNPSSHLISIFKPIVTIILPSATFSKWEWGSKLGNTHPLEQRGAAELHDPFSKHAEVLFPVSWYPCLQEKMATVPWWRFCVLKATVPSIGAFRSGHSEEKMLKDAQRIAPQLTV